MKILKLLWQYSDSAIAIYRVLDFHEQIQRISQFMQMTQQIYTKTYLAFVALALAASTFPTDSLAANQAALPVSAQHPLITRSESPTEQTFKIAQLNSTDTAPNLSAARRREIELEVEGLENDRELLNESLISAVERLREMERNTQVTQTQLIIIENSVEAIQSALDKRKNALVEVLAALQRIGKNPPPALVVQPTDALTAVRSAILFNAVMPEIREDVASLSAELSELNRLQQSIVRDKNLLDSEKRRISEEYVLIDALMAAKYAKIIENDTLLGRNTRQSQVLAENSDTLQDLVGEIDSNSQSAVVALLDPSAIRSSQPEQHYSIFGNAAREEPAIPFSEARGVLPVPVHGSIVKAFGDSDGNGGNLNGQIFTANPDAIVAAPCDGWVEFAGKFRSYGNLLILDAGNGYYVLLAGMAKIDVQLGQFVLTGEPIGRMGTEASVEIAGGVSQDWEQPVLYIEFRKDDSPINPNPWWGVTNKTKVRG